MSLHHLLTPHKTHIGTWGQQMLNWTAPPSPFHSNAPKQISSGSQRWSQSAPTTLLLAQFGPWTNSSPSGSSSPPGHCSQCPLGGFLLEWTFLKGLSHSYNLQDTIHSCLVATAIALEPLPRQLCRSYQTTWYKPLAAGTAMHTKTTSVHLTGSFRMRLLGCVTPNEVWLCFSPHG